MNHSLNILIGLGLTCVSQILWANQPSHLQIVKWISNLDQSNADPQHAITVERTEPVTLYSGEIAYLSSVIFENSARNFWGGYILTRPELEKSRILDFGGQANTFRIHPFYKNNKEFDLVEFESASSGQGATNQLVSLTYLHHWQVNELKSAEGGSYEGTYSEKLDAIDCKTGYDNSAFFNVMHYNGQVVETLVEADGCEHKSEQDYKISSRFIKIKIP